MNLPWRIKMSFRNKLNFRSVAHKSKNMSVKRFVLLRAALAVPVGLNGKIDECHVLKESTMF